MNSWDALCRWVVAHGTTCLEALGFLTGVVNVALAARASIWSWPVGLLNAALYMVVFAQSGLYADTGLQVVYLALGVVGWWYWWRGGPATTEAPMRYMTTREWYGSVAAVLLLWPTLALVTRLVPGARYPWFDAALVAGSLVAQWLLTRKAVEHWLLWIVIDALYVVLFAVRGLMLTMILYAVFFVLAIIGWVRWTRTLRTVSRSTPVPT
jgi:nicotinamide mononucleotide transporter